MNLCIQKDIQILNQQLTKIFKKCCSLFYFSKTTVQHAEELNIEIFFQLYEKLNNELNRWCVLEKEVNQLEKNIPQKELYFPNDIINYVANYAEKDEIEKLKTINQRWNKLLIDKDEQESKKILTIITSIDKTKQLEFETITHSQATRFESLIIEDIEDRKNCLQLAINEIEDLNLHDNIKNLTIKCNRNKRLNIEKLTLKNIILDNDFYTIKLTIHDPSNLEFLPPKVNLRIPSDSGSYDCLKYLHATKIEYDNMLHCKNKEFVLFPALKHFKFEAESFDIRFQELNLHHHMQNVTSLSLTIDIKSKYLNDNVSFLVTSFEQLEHLNIEICRDLYNDDNFFPYFAMCYDNDNFYNEIRCLEQQISQITNFRGIFIYNPPKKLKQLKLLTRADDFYISSPYLERILINEKSPYMLHINTDFYSTKPKGFGNVINPNCWIELYKSYSFENICNVEHINVLECQSRVPFTLEISKLQNCMKITKLCASGIKCNEKYVKNIIPMVWSFLKVIEVHFEYIYSRGLMNLDLSYCFNLESIYVQNASVKLSSQQPYRLLDNLHIINGCCWNQINNNNQNEFLCTGNLFPVLNAISICGTSSVVGRRNQSVILPKQLNIIIQNQFCLKKIEISSFEIEIDVLVDNIETLNSIIIQENKKINRLCISFSTLRTLTEVQLDNGNCFKCKETVLNEIKNQLQIWLKTPPQHEHEGIKKLNLRSNNTILLPNFDSVTYMYCDIPEHISTEYWCDSHRTCYYYNGALLNIHHNKKPIKDVL